MPFLKIKYSKDNKRTIVKEFECRDDIESGEIKSGETIIEVKDVMAYRNQTEQWNKSIDMRKAPTGQVATMAQKKEWDYDLISPEGKRAIHQAINIGTDKDWMVAMKYYNEETWATEVFCCAVQLPQFRERIRSMMKT